MARLTRRETWRMKNDILRGWKEIEDYVRLGREAIKHNLYPIHQNENNKNVYAFKSELDAFLKREQTRYRQNS